MNERIEYIERKQKLLEQTASKMEARLLNKLFERIEVIYNNPATLNKILREWQSTEWMNLVQQFGSDMVNIGRLNDNYFVVHAEDKAAYEAIKERVNSTVYSRLGINQKGKIVQGGILDEFINDTTVQRRIKQEVFKNVFGGTGLETLKKGLKEVVTPATGNGIINSHLNTFAYDTYQQVDRAYQTEYADRLELRCFIYAGGTIEGTRPFCRAKNGKVFTVDEAKNWANADFQGKPKNYNPLLMLGGYNCRHHLNFISNKEAIKRRPDLKDMLGE